MFNVEQFNRVEYTFCNESYSYGVDMIWYFYPAALAVIKELMN